MTVNKDLKVDQIRKMEGTAEVFQMIVEYKWQFKLIKVNKSLLTEAQDLIMVQVHF